MFFDYDEKLLSIVADSKYVMVDMACVVCLIFLRCQKSNEVRCDTQSSNHIQTKPAIAKSSRPTNACPLTNMSLMKLNATGCLGNVPYLESGMLQSMIVVTVGICLQFSGLA